MYLPDEVARGKELSRLRRAIPPATSIGKMRKVSLNTPLLFFDLIKSKRANIFMESFFCEEPTWPVNKYVLVR
jgi:hypothetical protein